MRLATLCVTIAALLGGCASNPPRPVAVRHPTYTPPGEARRASYPASPVAARAAAPPAAQPADCVPAAPGINAAQEDDLFRRFDESRAQGGDASAAQ
jgi:hypothetical protein